MGRSIYNQHLICYFCRETLSAWNINWEENTETGQFGVITVETSYETVRYDELSHTWVRYPGFSGHGVKCPILTTVVPGFSGDLIGCTIRSKWGPFGDLHLARKKSSLCVK